MAPICPSLRRCHGGARAARALTGAPVLFGEGGSLAFLALAVDPGTVDGEGGDHTGTDRTTAGKLTIVETPTFGTSV